MKLEKSISINITVLMIFFLFFSCSKDNPTELEKEPEVTITDIAGSWSGTTSQNKSIKFNITSEDNGANKITYFKITIKFGSSEAMKEVWGELGYVTKDKHDFLIALPGDPFVSISSVFTSNSNSNGEFSSGSTEGTWKATKQ